MKELSRRDFLRTAAVGAAGIATLGLTACTANEPGVTEPTPAPVAPEVPVVDNSMKWDKEAELVVVGTGTAITSAIAASEFGAQSIIILEKSENIFGGTSMVSGGGYSMPGFLEDFKEEGIEDSRESVLAYMRAVGEDRMDDKAMTAFVDNAGDYVDWVKALFGWAKWGHGNRSYGDYYELYTNSIAEGYGRGSSNPMDAEGNVLRAGAQWEAYKAYVDEHDNIELMMGTVGEELLTDEKGAVIGIYANQGGNRIAIKAEKAVILGTGGFDHNENMRRYHLPFPLVRSAASVNNTGDAQRMGAKIGAQLAFMDRLMGAPAIYDQPTWNDSDDHNYSLMASTALIDYTMFLNLPNSLCVNRKGRRFANESRFYDNFNRAFGTYDTGLMKFVNIPAFWICDSDYVTRFLLPGYKSPADLPEYVFQFNTLEELAEGMGIEKDGLLDEVKKFNKYVADGYDPDWHRGESMAALDTALSTVQMFGFGDYSDLTTPQSLLGTVAKGPFYCCRYVPSSLNTRGGLLIDEHSQVVNLDGNTIPGLYAIGTCSTGVAGYWAGGSPISQGAVMSFVAAKHLYA